MNEVNEDVRAARYEDLFENAHRTPDCAYCPICATISVVRNTRPELLDHLAAAARELVVAAGIMLEEAGEIIGNDPRARPRPTAVEDPKVTRIDIG